MKREMNRFFVSIVLPSILAIGLYILSIFVVILPSFEKNSMGGKKEMIAELTNTACSLIEEYHQEVRNGNMLEDSARALAIDRVSLMRYGDEGKDYFWIIDREPVMVMHPYRSELTGTSLSNYQDSEGKLLFVEATEVVFQEGEGFINYMWQWQDDSTQIVPKLSYVKGIAPWNWIVGTGIYIEDVRAEIRGLKRRLLSVAFIITLIISAILAFIIRQSLFIENKRKDAEKRLRLSREKYKSLVEASTEGTLMLLSDKIIYSNFKFNILSGCQSGDVRNMKVEELFDVEWKALIETIDDPKKSLSRETTLICHDKTRKEVVISVSVINYAGELGYIIVVKELSKLQIYKKESSQLEKTLQTSLLLMNQSISFITKPGRKCSAEKTISEAAQLMERKKEDVLLITHGEQVIGLINSSDMKSRVVARGLDLSLPVSEIMSAPVVSISGDAMLFEAMLKMKERGVSNLGIRGEDGVISGVIGFKELIGLQQNTIAFFIGEIEGAEEVHELVTLYKRLPVLLGGLLEGGEKVRSITRMISAAADAFHKRVLGLAIEEFGPPPCRFAFMVMGSEGRGEQTLATDQDNAIIIEDAVEGVESYFMKFAEKVNKDLDTVGYQYCKGDVMAKNPKWNCELNTWKGYFTSWLTTSNPQDIMDASIFFDFRFIFGDETLVHELRNHVNEVSDGKAVFYYHMAQSVMKFKPPHGVIGHVGKKSAGSVDLMFDVKKVLMPIVGYLRLLSIQQKLEANNSFERARLLYKSQELDARSYEQLLDAFGFLSNIRLKWQVAKISENEAPDNVIDAGTLTEMELVILKKAFGDVDDLLTKLEFSIS